MHRTLYGVDADPVNLLLGGMRCAVADLAGCYMATDIADILFGIPKPRVTEANLGTLKAGAVNIALHGHNPVLSDVLVTRAATKNAAAMAAGASGINIVGICCTGNEIMMRHGIPACTHSVSQEMAILTGALDAMVVDYQCIMPSVATVAECMGTTLITTMDIGKIPGANTYCVHRRSGRGKGGRDFRYRHSELHAPQKQARGYSEREDAGGRGLFGGSHSGRALEAGRERASQTRRG